MQASTSTPVQNVSNQVAFIANQSVTTNGPQNSQIQVVVSASSQSQKIHPTSTLQTLRTLQQCLVQQPTIQQPRMLVPIIQQPRLPQTFPVPVGAPVYVLQPSVSSQSAPVILQPVVANAASNQQEVSRNPSVLTVVNTTNQVQSAISVSSKDLVIFQTSQHTQAESVKSSEDCKDRKTCLQIGNRIHNSLAASVGVGEIDSKDRKSSMHGSNGIQQFFSKIKKSRSERSNIR